LRYPAVHELRHLGCYTPSHTRARTRAPALMSSHTRARNHAVVYTAVHELRHLGCCRAILLLVIGCVAVTSVVGVCESEEEHVASDERAIPHCSLDHRAVRP
jgi:hypothetical protein